MENYTLIPKPPVGTVFSTKDFKNQYIQAENEILLFQGEYVTDENLVVIGFDVSKENVINFTDTQLKLL